MDSRSSENHSTNCRGRLFFYQRQMKQESAFNELHLAYPDFCPDAIIRT